MTLWSEQFYKCAVEMKVPGKAARDQVGKAFHFQLLQTKAHGSWWGGLMQRMGKGRERSKRAEEKNE